MDSSVDTAASPDRPAAWWAWPVIIVSLLTVIVMVNFSPDDIAGEDGPIESAADEGDLAILKLQGQVLISAAKLDPAGSQAALTDLRTLATSDRSRAAVLLIEDFVGAEADPAELLGAIDSESFRSQITSALDAGVDSGEREALRDEIGWFAELARGPDDSAAPRRSEIEVRATLTLVAATAIAFLAFCGLAAGGVLLFLYQRRLRDGSLQNQFDPAVSPAGVFLESFALYLGISMASELLAAFLPPAFQYAGYGLSVIIPLVWPLVRGVSWRDCRQSLGIHRGRGVWREIGAGMVGYLGVVSIASIGICITLLITALTGAFAPAGGEGEAGVSPQTHPIVGWIYKGGVVARILLFLLAAGFAPLFEEIFFRGALHRYFRKRFQFFASALLTGVIFAALHPQGLAGIPALASIGIGFSLLREWRDSLIAPMVAHALNNGILVALLWIML